MRDALILNLGSLIEFWILDSATSLPSSPNKKLFRNFRSKNFENAYLADKKA